LQEAWLISRFGPAKASTKPSQGRGRAVVRKEATTALCGVGIPWQRETFIPRLEAI
jgi:hypothetical protein